MENGKRELACEKDETSVKKLELNLRRRTIWSLRICITDDIEVATIALQLQSRLTSLVAQWRQRHLPKSALHFQSIVSLFSRFHRGHDCAGLVVALPRKTILDMRRFRVKKKSTIWWKTRDKIDVSKYPYPHRDSIWPWFDCYMIPWENS